MPEWDAEVEIDETLVRALLSDQFPEVDASSARLLGEGWDNAVWVLEERWAFRFPRREIALPGVQRELAISPRLATLLPLPIPVPRFIGKPSDRYPWPFFGAPLLRGREAADAGLADEQRVELGRALGRFLRALHAPATLSRVDPGLELPLDPNRRTDMRARVDIAGTWLAELENVGWQIRRDPGPLFEAALELDPPVAEVVVHGDLHLRHVLVHEGAELGASIAAARIEIPHVTAGALWFRPDLVGQFRHLALAVMPRSWVAPDEVLPATVMFIRSEGAGPAGEPVPPWLAELPSDRPLVHVTMGTTEVTRTPGLYETTLAALRDEPLSVVVASGNDPAELGPQPDHIRVERFVSHGAVLPRCRAVVTHGGHGTLMACFALGIPVVVVPVNADQPRNAARCEALGVGRSVPPASRTPEAIRDALREVMTDDRYAARARALGEEMAALPGYDAAVGAIEDVARRP